MIPASNGSHKVIAERSWDDVYDAPRPAPVQPVDEQRTPPDAPEPRARQLFRSAVTTVAIRAVETMPGSEGRIASAVKLVLAGDVETLPDGTARIGNQSAGETVFHVNGICPCPDAVYRGKDGAFCKHRIALAIYRRAVDQVKTQLEPSAAPVDAGAVSMPTALPAPAPPPHGEAPASVNVYVEMAGRKVQITLRDTDEHALIVRLQALLERFPVSQESAALRDSIGAPVPSQAPAEGWCAVHGVQMRQGQNERGSWWSHNVDGIWCKGK